MLRDACDKGIGSNVPLTSLINAFQGHYSGALEALHPRGDEGEVVKHGLVHAVN